MHRLAKNLALTSDCLNEANDRQVFLVRETATLTRKAEKARLQIEQEKLDKEIIVQDLNKLNQERDKLVASGKASFKRRMTTKESSGGGSSSNGRFSYQTRRTSAYSVSR